MRKLIRKAKLWLYIHHVLHQWIYVLNEAGITEQLCAHCDKYRSPFGEARHRRSMELLQEAPSEKEVGFVRRMKWVRDHLSATGK